MRSTQGSKDEGGPGPPGNGAISSFELDSQLVSVAALVDWQLSGTARDRLEVAATVSSRPSPTAVLGVIAWVDHRQLSASLGNRRSRPRAGIGVATIYRSLVLDSLPRQLRRVRPVDGPQSRPEDVGVRVPLRDFFVVGQSDRAYALHIDGDLRSYQRGVCVGSTCSPSRHQVSSLAVQSSFRT